MKAKQEFIELVLTCGSWQEAQKITDSLLEKRLVAYIELMEVKSKYHWQNKLEAANEIKLIMQTIADNFDKVEEEVAKLHSYTTFELQAVPISRLSGATTKWQEEAITNER